MVALFAVNWLLRRGALRDSDVPAFVLFLAGVGLAVVTGWLGGEQIDRLEMGVDRLPF